ncbi:hypothetical protein Ais01nite_28530 [Asanoa ishikariensis]|uniref:Uncharacterized protein n=1 Tax=Asanoa ishikariensis TaxID=137265 RepID=A0A1H3QQM0_9ACTN|nr:hypothetical protein Ais01nite_28530 [Asanoa ishikariensis]SDZ15298.1 hypothetical protein SAMN05421684_3068 [Asanoa ishikariensis]
MTASNDSGKVVPDDQRERKPLADLTHNAPVDDMYPLFVARLPLDVEGPLGRDTLRDLHGLPLIPPARVLRLIKDNG